MEQLISVRSLFKETDAYAGKQIKVGGWVRNLRASKNFGFINLSDGTFFSQVQVVYGSELANFAEISKLNIGAAVIVTGIVGALLAETVCKVFHITDPIAKGVGIGTSAHAVGTSKALQMGEVEGAMSGLSIAVAGVLTAVLCPVFVGFVH